MQSFLNGMPGFDNQKYIKLQSEHIKARIESFGGKLYLEYGGKLFDDYHASRVLPGFEPDTKVRMLMQLKDEAEIVVVVSADDIQKNKIRGDLGITYDLDALRLIDAFGEIGLYVGSVVITHYASQSAAVAFEKRLDALGIKVYRHFPIEGYPHDYARVISDQGYGRNEYVETKRRLVVITAPGPGSGKMAVALSQLYNDQKKGITAGYAKFETFPIWNLPQKHPVNLAYEAATADLSDVNMIDPFHFEAYGLMAVNYNRDIEIFPILQTVFERIYGVSPYKSPTDMGVNMAGSCIIDNEIVEAAAKQELIRRYFAELCAKRKGNGSDNAVFRIELLMKQAGVSVSERRVVAAAIEKSETTGCAPTAALELPNGTIITGKTSPLLGASSALLLNALKELAGIGKDVMLISPDVIEPIRKLKTKHLGNRNPRLHTDEVLIALSICAVTDNIAALAMEQLNGLRNCEAHSTVLLSQVDESMFKKLGINLTCEPQYQSKRLYHKH